jgi:hypothetical protein
VPQPISPRNRLTVADVTGGQIVPKIWPGQTVGLVRGEFALFLKAKLRPLIVLSTRDEIVQTDEVFVVPASRWHPEGQTKPDIEAITSNQVVPHIHWLPGSQRFSVIDACTLDFRWTWRIPVSVLNRAQPRAAQDLPAGPVARLRSDEIDGLLRRFRLYLS